MAGKTLYDKKKKGTAKNEKFVYKSVWNSTLDAGAGNDVIVLGRSSANTNIYDGEIMDVTYTSKIYGGAGNDTIAMDPKECTVDGGAGNDKLEFPSAMDSIVNGGSGNDFINFMGWCSTINGGAGNDTIQLWGWDTDLTVSGGAGKDTFRLLPNYDYEKRTVRTSTWGTITDLSAEDTLHFSINPWDAISKSSPFYQKDGKISSLSAYRSDSEVILKDDSGYGVNLVLKNITDMSKLGRVKVLNGSKAKKATTLRSLISVSPLPKGITTKGSQLVIGNSFQGGFYFSNYISWAKNINASSSKKRLTIEGDVQNNIITAGSAANVLYGLGGNDKLIGGKSNDKLYGGAGKDTLIGGVGNDYLRGDAGNDTLTGGKGNDTFVYAQSTGKDVISDYNKYGKDTIHISSGAVSKVALANSNKNMVFTVGSGTVTLTGAGAKTISMKDSRGAYTLKKTALTLTNTSKGTFNASNYLTATLKTIDGRKATKAVNLYGNAMKNVIYAGKGGGTLRGYAGNDTLYGGVGKDIFYYDSGNDIIDNYQKNDIINLGGTTLSSVTVSNNGNDNVLRLANGKRITIKDSRNTTFTVQSKNGTQEMRVQLIEYLGPVVLMNGTANADRIKGLDSSDEIHGLAGDDYLEGGAGDDYLYGEAGNDTLIGGIGRDKLRGGAGDDYLDSGADDSYLEGGSGKDTLIGGTGSNAMAGEWGNDYFCCGSKDGVSHDTIEDYNANEAEEDDVIVFMDDLTMTSAAKTSDSEYDHDVLITLSNGSTILVYGAEEKTITYKQQGQLYTLAKNGDGEFVSTPKAASGMIANSAPIVGTSSARLASLVSTTQTGSLGGLTNTGLASPDASGSSLIAASGGTSNPLTNQKSA